MFSDKRKYGGGQWGEINWKDAYNKLVDGDDNYRLLFEPTGSEYGGVKGFKMSLLIGDLRIDFDDNFYPKNFKNYVNEDAPETIAAVKHNATAAVYEKFKESWLYSKLPENDKHWTKKAIYAMMKGDKAISDFRFYPDLPFFDDSPVEVQPFNWLGWMLSLGNRDYSYDFRQDAATFKAMADIQNEKLSMKDKVMINTQLNNTEKMVQATNWPGKNKYHEAESAIAFKHFATSNYQNEELPLTFRTNNWFALSSANWNGEIDLGYTRGDRKFAVFSHPADSARAVIRTILNNSSLTYGINDVKKVLGETPTVWDILSKIPYATDLDGYANALEKSKHFAKDTTIDLTDKNQMHKFLKFIMIHEMGGPKVFNTHIPINAQPIVDTYIMMGIEKGLASYEGKLGTYQ